MTVDCFMKLDGIEGDSVAKDHEGEIDVLAWSWGMTNSGTTHIATGGGGGVVSVQDIVLTKRIDKASTALMLACLTGKHIGEGILTCRKAGGDEGQIDYLKITMTDIIITNHSTGGSGDSDFFTENVALNFAKVEVEFWPQEAAGGQGGSSVITYNIAQKTQE